MADDGRTSISEAAEGLALFLDIDGTLAEIESRPELVRIAPPLKRTIADLAGRLDGAVAILTGRQIADADRLLAPLRLPIAGVHGAEWRPTAAAPVTGLAPPLPPAFLASLRGILSSLPAARLEIKGAAAAIHYRQSPEAAVRLASAVSALLEPGSDIIAVRGRMVIELRHRDHHKGVALRRFMALPPFDARRPLMIGDDRLDEPAFEAARQLGGAGLRVAGESIAIADADFTGVGDVARFLARLARSAAAAQRSSAAG